MIVKYTKNSKNYLALIISDRNLEFISVRDLYQFGHGMMTSIDIIRDSEIIERYNYNTTKEMMDKAPHLFL